MFPQYQVAFWFYLRNDFKGGKDFEKKVPCTLALQALELEALSDLASADGERDQEGGGGDSGRGGGSGSSSGKRKCGGDSTGAGEARGSGGSGSGDSGSARRNETERGNKSRRREGDEAREDGGSGSGDGRSCSSRRSDHSVTHPSVIEKTKPQLDLLLNEPKTTWTNMFNLKEIKNPPTRPTLIKLAGSYNMEKVFKNFLDYTAHNEAKYTSSTKAFTSKSFNADTPMTFMEVLKPQAKVTKDLRLEIGLTNENTGSNVHSLSAISEWIKDCNLPYVEEIVKKLQHVVKANFADHKVSAAVFATAPTSSPNLKSETEWCSLHFDDGGAIVILLYGKKKWCFLPHDHVTWSEHPGAPNEALDILPWTKKKEWQEANMEAGDVLLMPSREAHLVWTDASTASLSLNIFIQRKDA